MISMGSETMATDETTTADAEKQWWEHRVPFVDFKCSCSECVYDGGTDLSDVETFVLGCKRFGKEMKKTLIKLEGHKEYLADYREKILKPMIATGSGKRKAKAGRIQLLLLGHRHSFHDLGRSYAHKNGKKLTKEELKEEAEVVKKRVIRDQRIHRSIPIFPYNVDPGATFELFEHAFKALDLVMEEHGSGQPIELHVQLGSNNAVTGALLHALYHYRILKDAKVHIFTYLVDNNYDDDWTEKGLDAKLHQMPLPQLDKVVPYHIAFKELQIIL